jgi:hypothetical protein
MATFADLLVIGFIALMWVAAALAGRDSRDGRDWRSGASASSRPSRLGD